MESINGNKPDLVGTILEKEEKPDPPRRRGRPPGKAPIVRNFPTKQPKKVESIEETVNDQIDDKVKEENKDDDTELDETGKASEASQNTTD